MGRLPPGQKVPVTQQGWDQWGDLEAVTYPLTVGTAHDREGNWKQSSDQNSDSFTAGLVSLQ